MSRPRIEGGTYHNTACRRPYSAVLVRQRPGQIPGRPLDEAPSSSTVGLLGGASASSETNASTLRVSTSPTAEPRDEMRKARQLPRRNEASTKRLQSHVASLRADRAKSQSQYNWKRKGVECRRLRVVRPTLSHVAQLSVASQDAG